MQLSVTLLLVFVTGALTGPAPTGDIKSFTNRGQRLFFGPLSSFVGLGGGASVSVSKASVAPNIFLVQQPQSSQSYQSSSSQSSKTCPTPHSVVGCPVGYFCSATYTCIPRKPTGTPCTTGYECLGGKCRGQVCVKDLCQTTVWRSGCPPGQECVSTDGGYACQPKDDSCYPPLALGNCPAGKYCGSDSRCATKLPVNAVCQTSIQCEHGICRNYRCKDDQCPTIDSSQDCQPYEYCTSSSNGNVCRARRADGEPCEAATQCSSNTCERSRCVTNECELSSYYSSCPDGQYCVATHEGNVCHSLLDRGDSCSEDRQCQSGECTQDRCFDDECPAPLMTEDCMPNQICITTPIGNTCMMKLPVDAQCTADIQCLSGNCQDGTVCQPQEEEEETEPLANGEDCDTNMQCASGRCSGGQCRAALLDNGATCDPAGSANGDQDCRSNNCVAGPPPVCTIGALAMGAICNDDLQCAMGQCDDEGFCA